MFCNSLTSTGNKCKNSKNCHLHSDSCETCSICLSNIRKTRAVKQLPCGHMFHNKCLNPWKETGGNTCPMCRQTFDESKYKISINIQNTQTQYSNTIISTMESIAPFLEDIGFLSEFTVNIDSDQEMDSFLNTLNIRLADLDPSIFHTE